LTTLRTARDGPAGGRSAARRPRRSFSGGWRANAALALVLTLLLLAALAPAWHRPESQFDEGFTLAYAARVLDGDLPHRDFMSFYGPGNSFIVAGAFAIGGESQTSERVVGVLYRLLIVLGAAGLVACVGRIGALCAGAAAIPLLLPLGVPAFASPGALGFGLAGLALLAHARSAQRAAVPAALGATLVGIAGAIRPDYGIAVVLASVPLLLGADRRVVRAAALGLVPWLLVAAVDLALVGPARAWHVVSELRASSPGRRLPFDPFSDVSEFAEASRVMVLVLACAAVGIGLAVRACRRGADTAWRAPLALAVLAVALVPYALSRLDYTHAVMPLVPAVAAVVAVAAVAAQRHSRAVRLAIPPSIAAALVTVALLAAPHLLGGFARQHANRLLGRIPAAEWVPAGLAGRTFGLPSPLAHDVQRVVDAAERERRRGARTLFAGPRDLRRGWQNDAFLYFVLADLRPASYYLEINPWTANAPGSGLADELRRADVLILNSGWDVFDEPNESARYGPDDANRVVRERFCPVEEAGTLTVLRRCR
jgi:hypothetical protein